MAISMYRLSFTLLLSLVAMLSTTTVRADDPAASSAFKSLADAGWAAVVGNTSSSAGPKLAVANSGNKAVKCAFYITNKCKSKKRVYFTSGSKGSWGQISLGTFYVDYKKSTGKLETLTTAYLRLSRNIKFPNAGTATFCTHPKNLLFMYYYDTELAAWASYFPGTTTIDEVGFTCPSIGGKLLGGYQRLKTCGQKIVLTKC